MEQNKFYITTPIYYINDVPHIGHTCTTVGADILARWRRQKGEKVFFLTGTDEHGQKVAEAAEAKGLKPKDYCDTIAPRFEEAWKSLNIAYDFFIRTTDKRHEKVVAEVLDKIYKNGDIYKSKYEGPYCVGCEKFLTQTDMVEGKCPLHPGDKTVARCEDNWFFKLSKYVPKLIELIENKKTNYIYPEGKRREILSKLKAGVDDVSVSREKVSWGIATPWDKSQTVYVWFDALLNYYSATRFVKGKSGFWPAEVHLIGKEISWFHTVIWQAMLMSAGIALPKKVFVHSFYTIDGQKMSKSLGNVITPKQLIDRFGVDGSRYLIAISFPNKDDSDVGMEKFKQRYNADLANNLGNLVSRLTKLAEGLRVEKTEMKEKKKFDQLANNFCWQEAVAWVFKKYVDKTNAKLNEAEPWKLAKDDPKRIKILEESVVKVRKAAWYLEPIMPQICEKIKRVLAGEIKPLTSPLFARIND